VVGGDLDRTHRVGLAAGVRHGPSMAAALAVGCA
jgi:hypothetical protein